jgi:hypothetical protein
MVLPSAECFTSFKMVFALLCHVPFCCCVDSGTLTLALDFILGHLTYRSKGYDTDCKANSHLLINPGAGLCLMFFITDLILADFFLACFSINISGEFQLFRDISSCLEMTVTVSPAHRQSGRARALWFW